MNKYFLDEDYSICEVSDKNPNKSRELLKYQACERLNQLNNKVIYLQAQLKKLNKCNNLHEIEQKKPKKCGKNRKN